MKYQLVFNTAAPADSDNIGAYLRSSDGTLLTHTDVGGKKALDVRVAEGINVEVDLNAADDSVAAWMSDGSGNALSSTSGALHISDGGGSLTVDATNFDIRDLAAASDSVAAWLSDGSGNAIGSTAGALNVNISSGSLTINDAALANTAVASASKNCTDVASVAVASALSNRKYLWLRNFGNKRIYVGPSGVSTSSGYPLDPGSALEARAGAAVALYMVAASGDTIDTRSLEIS